MNWIILTVLLNTTPMSDFKTEELYVKVNEITSISGDRAIELKEVGFSDITSNVQTCEFTTSNNNYIQNSLGSCKELIDQINKYNGECKWNC